jgi:hypothetical protein
MKTGLDFLLAAKRCEIDGLQRLAFTATLVDVTARLVHGLQRERGLTNLFLGSQGRRFAEARATQVAASRQVEAEWRAQFQRVDAGTAQAGHGARLFSRIAYVLQGLDGLDALRAQLDTQAWDTARATEAYVRLVAALLAVVFEAADSASDPEVSRRLVALFNFMQGKELAGQERATAAAGFASGVFDTARQQRMTYLIEAQQRCFDLFAEFADAPVVAQWREALPAEDVAELERLRRMAVSPQPAGIAPASRSEHWFDLATRRIDGLRAVEERLADILLHLAQQKIVDARAALDDHAALLKDFADDPQQAPAAVFFDAFLMPGASADSLNPQFGRSVLDLLREQAQRLQTMSDELARARTALHERKVIERAKGMLMQHRGLTEDQAYRMLRQTAMDRGRRLAEVAEAVLGFSDFLQDEGSSRRP